MTRRPPNLLDRLAGLIPGYRGYADRESRRTTDKTLRQSIASQLDRMKRDVDGVVLALTDSGRMDGLADLDRLKREIGACADAIRLAPAGGSGWLDDVVVRAEDLDRAHDHDLTLQQAVTDLAGAMALAASSGDATALTSLSNRVKELRDDIARRESVLREMSP